VTTEERLRLWFEREAPAEVVSAYLFGSEAEGRSHRESDVDVGLLFDRVRRPEEAARVRLDWIVRLGDALAGRAVDVVDLRRAPALLARAIVVDGRRLHCRDREADLRFRLETLSKAFDLAPWWERVERLKLEALAAR
jgi:predicted nucleotidyltransferase